MPPSEPAPPWRVLRSGPGAPAWNMAVDEALLERCRPGDAPVLRLYRWSPAALSLGRFQPARDLEVPAGATLVRRITGGAALHHRPDEVTYAVVAPYARFGARDPRAAYHAVHDALALALARLGVPLERGAAGDARAPLRGMCFAAATDYDLVAAGRKLVGSAQRRRGHAFLQHGALPVSPDPAVPGAVSLRELVTGPLPAVEAIEAAIVDAFQERLGPGRDDALRPAEIAEAERLVVARYGAAAWTLER
ncbi:MAG: lipoate--protein ligase family protein [Planctomycetes bacterium]|nr:lipoate--protein ligase family protein [Planctomycetota bacterium]